MNRRDLLLAIPIGGLLSMACGPSLPRDATPSYSEIDATCPDQGSSRTIVGFMPRTLQAQEVWAGLRDELAKDFCLVAVEVPAGDCAPVIIDGMRRHHPSAIVLMNNPTLVAYRKIQRLSVERRFPPAVVVMTSFLERRPADMVATTGISYEVPLITVVTNLRRLVANPINNIGIVARSGLRGFVARQAALAAREHIAVHTEEVGAEPSAVEIKSALRRVKQGADAVWILNDDHLLTQRLIADAWVPGMNERPYVPAIVGAAPLVAPGVGVGTFALLPDHTALGAQAANIILEVAENNWVLPEGADVQLPLSTVSTIDLVQARERFVLRADALHKVDKLLQ